VASRNSIRCVWRALLLFGRPDFFCETAFFGVFVNQRANLSDLTNVAITLPLPETSTEPVATVSAWPLNGQDPTTIIETDEFQRLPEGTELYAAQVPAQGTVSPESWRCFHCNGLFATADSAQEHFGKSEFSEPACQIDISTYREMENRVLGRGVLHQEINGVWADHEMEGSPAEGKTHSPERSDVIPDEPVASQEAEPVAKVVNLTYGGQGELYGLLPVAKTLPAPGTLLYASPTPPAGNDIKDAARYRQWLASGSSMSYRGEDYEDKASLDAAIDAEIKDAGKAALPQTR
jgi:hypothetical protein